MSLLVVDGTCRSTILHHFQIQRQRLQNCIRGVDLKVALVGNPRGSALHSVYHGWEIRRGGSWYQPGLDLGKPSYGQALTLFAHW